MAGLEVDSAENQPDRAAEYRRRGSSAVKNKAVGALTPNAKCSEHITESGMNPERLMKIIFSF